MELLPAVIADGCALYLQDHRALVVSDLHVGYERELQDAGTLVLKEQQAFFDGELARLLEAYAPRVVVLNGDVKHAFYRISQDEWSGVKRVITLLQGRAEVVVVGGNHDNMLQPILEQLDLEVVNHLLLKDILIVHGDTELEKAVDTESLKTVKTVIMGHEHPAVTISDGVRKETAKCYLVGKHLRRNLIVMPSFNPLTFGTDVVRGRPLGPLLRTFGGFSAFAVVGAEVLAFGRREDLRRLA